jgi:hypothetical protein
MLLQGDALAVQLFIGATAVSALSVAMTQAGWTQKWFVAGMFGLAAVLAAASIGWPSFEDHAPLVNVALQKVALSRVAWFFAGTIPALVIGIHLSDWLRRRRAVTKVPLEWHTLSDAMEKLARQDLLDRYEYVNEQLFDAGCEQIQVEIRIAELQKLRPLAEEKDNLELAERYAILAEEKAKRSEKNSEWARTAANSYDALRINIFAQLQKGELIAKGFVAPHVPGSAERIVPIEEWRLLSLDERGDRASGPDFEYVSLLIGRPVR